MSPGHNLQAACGGCAALMTLMRLHGERALCVETLSESTCALTAFAAFSLSCCLVTDSAQRLEAFARHVPHEAWDAVLAHELLRVGLVAEHVDERAERDRVRPLEDLLRRLVDHSWREVGTRERQAHLLLLVQVGQHDRLVLRPERAQTGELRARLESGYVRGDRVHRRHQLHVVSL
eukprot:2647023-Prymnesium_polylepis.2